MKKIYIIATILIALFALAFQSSPYARRIRPFASTPVSCAENEIGYNMTSHAILICTNSGYQSLATGGSGGTAAPTDATYITKTANSSLSAEFALGSLATGILKNTTTTGTPSIALAGTDYESPLTFSSPLSRTTNTISCSTCGLTPNPLSQFASTTSAQLAGVLSNESGAAGVFILGNFTSLTTNDVLTWNGTDWINQAVASGGGTLGSGNVNMTIANASSTGTTVNRLAKLTGAPSTALVTSTSDTENAIGVVTSGAGTTGSAVIAILGQVSCDFDNATTAGNYVTISAITAGKCHDAGSSYPVTGAAYGRVLTTNGASGTFSMELMTPDIAFQNAGNGKSKPGGNNLQFQYNDSNQFGGANLYREDANTIAQRNGITTQVSDIYDEFTSVSNYQKLQFHKNSAGQFEILSDAQSTSAMELAFKVAGTSNVLILGTGDLRPVNNRGYNLGSSTSNMFNQLFIFRIDLNGDGLFFTGGPQFISGGGGWLQMRDSAGTSNLTRITMGDPGVTGVSLTKPASSTYVETRNGDNTAYVFDVTAGNEFTSSQFDKTSTVLADVTGLTSETLTAGKTYSFEALLFVDADVTGGSKYAIAGTATATAIKYNVDMLCNATNLNVINSRQTALAGSAGQAGCTAGLTRISGTITVNAAGTLTTQFAQNAANGTSSVLTMSKFEVRQLN